MSWETVPICNYCWRLQHSDGREPVRVRNRRKEVCHYCEEETYSGIYVRAEVNQ